MPLNKETKPNQTKPDSIHKNKTNKKRQMRSRGEENKKRKTL